MVLDIFDAKCMMLALRVNATNANFMTITFRGHFVP